MAVGIWLIFWKKIPILGLYRTLFERTLLFLFPFVICNIKVAVTASQRASFIDRRASEAGPSHAQQLI